MSILKTLRKWVTGKSDEDDKKKKRDALRVTNYGGGAARNDTKGEVKRSIQKAERAKERKAQSSSAFKATPPSVKKAEAKDKQTKPTQSSAFKATSPTLKKQSTALGTVSEKEVKTRTAKMNAFEANQKEKSRAADKLKPLMDEKYSTRKAGVPTYVKQGNYAADPLVAKYNVLKHPVATSATRGAVSGVTFGASELAIKKLPKSKEAEDAERFYQANKNQAAETIGELAGSLTSFGGTAGATEKLSNKVFGKSMANAAERLAEKQFVKNAAGRLVERGVEKGVIGSASEELIKQVGKDKATKIVNALGTDIVQNLTTGALYDVNKASAEYEVGSKEWWKELGKSAVMNSLITTGIAGGSAITGGRQLVQDAADMVAKRATVRKELRPFGNLEPQRQKPRIGESIEDRIARMDAERLGANADEVATSKAVEPEAETKTSKKKLTAEERRERMISKADENADAVRAALGEEYGEPTKGAKPAAETLEPKDGVKEYTVQLKRENGKSQKVKVEAASDKEALDKAIGRKKGVKKASIIDTAEAQPKAEAPKANATTQETKNINLDDSVGKKRVKKTFREQFHELASSAKTKISDSLNAFEEANKQYIKTDHQKWLENVGAIDKARRYNAIAGRSIGEGQVKWKNGDVYEGGKSLKAIYDGMDEATEKDFDKYLLMRHAPDRIREGKPIFAGTQYDSVEACEREARALLEKHPEFAERAEELYQYTRNELQNRVDAGLLKQEVADEWSKKYPNYVPTGRDGDFGGEYDIWDIRGQLNGNTIGAGEIQKAKGGDQPIRSIKEQLADATNRNWRDMSMNNLFKKTFGDKMGDELATYADGGLEKVLDNTINLSKSKDGGKYFAEVFENGEMKRVEIEKSFYDAIEDLYKNGRLGNGLDVLTDAASKPAWLFKNLITSWNPIFMVKNFCRDFPEAIINSRQTKEFLYCMPYAARELATGGEYLKAFRNSGVSQANFIDLEKALTKGDKWYKKPFDKFAASQEAVETFPRLVEYMATLKKAGVDITKPDGLKNISMELRDIAAANAADVTVNFGRSGSVGKMLNKGLVPFFNPSVQGWSKFLRNFSEQESTKSFLTFAVKAAALGSGLTTINNVFLEDNPNYQQISARDKATNLIIPITFGKDVTKDNTNVFIKIPKSRFAAVYGLPTVNIANENKIGWAEAINVVRDQVFVVDPLENNILAPLMAAKANTTWYGTPIVPKAVENKTNPSQEYDANTSWLGRRLGKATENLPTELQISPKKFDYIVDAETGVIGDFGLPMMTPSKQGGGNGFEKYVKHPWGNVLKKSFTIDSVTQNNLSTRFYDKLQVATDNKDKEESKRLNGYSTEVGKINTAIRALQNGNRKTKQEDIYGLQKVRNQMMQDAIDGKDVPSEYKAMDAVQKYVGTTYAINNFGSAADKDAMKLYGAAKYGDISKQEMRKAINDDKDFFKGVKSIGKLDDKMSKAGIDSNTVLTKAVALASSDSNDELFGAYGATYKSRTESDNKMNRARTYFKDGGSENEYVELENARKTIGKLPADVETKELDKLDEQVAKGEISLAEHKEKAKAVKYNANLSYIGLATTFAQINAPERGYRLYDIKDKNIQKGINLAAMGFTARDYKEMSKALDTNGNGYPSKQEIIDYVNKSGVKDKATLYDALYYYQGKYNPFGTPTNYTREQAAAMGKQRGLKSISDDTGEFKLNPESTSGSGRGYYRRGYRRWRRWGRSGGSSKAATHKISAFKAKNNTVRAKAVATPKTTTDVKSTANVGKVSTKIANTRRTTSATPSAKIPLNIKTVKPSNSTGKSGRTNLSAALEDIQKTQKKLAPPKARR